MDSPVDAIQDSLDGGESTLKKYNEPSFCGYYSISNCWKWDSRCEININECLLTHEPCLNGGKCIDSVNAFYCSCPKGFTGTNCEVNIDDCASYGSSSEGPCHHGRCLDGINSFSCLCDRGYTGHLCQTQINECLSTVPVCAHGGTCEDRIDGFDCICPPGTGGPRCENNVNDCFSNPCINGGRCIDGINKYTCECEPGYAGMVRHSYSSY